MPYGLWFNLCGVILAAALIVIAGIGRSISSFQNKIFKIENMSIPFIDKYICPPLK